MKNACLIFGILYIPFIIISFPWFGINLCDLHMDKFKRKTWTIKNLPKIERLVGKTNTSKNLTQAQNIYRKV